jgi:hypothetical protein
LFIRLRASSRCRFFCLTASALLTATLAANRAQAQDRSQCLAAHADSQILRMKGSLMAAREQLLVCSQTKCPGPIANDCAGWLGEVDNSLSSVVFAVSDEQGRDMPSVHVFADGKLLTERTDGRALVLDPGTYAFRFEAAGYPSVEATVAMRQSEKNRILRVQMMLPAPSPKAVAAAAPQAPKAVRPSAPASASAASSQSSDVPLATWILGGTTLLGVGTFAYFGLSGNSKKKQVEQCTADCDELKSSGKRDYVIADIGLVVAIASAPAAILVYLLRPSAPSDSAHSSAMRLQPIALQRGAGMAWSGEFCARSGG